MFIYNVEFFFLFYLRLRWEVFIWSGMPPLDDQYIHTCIHIMVEKLEGTKYPGKILCVDIRQVPDIVGIELPGIFGNIGRPVFFYWIHQLPLIPSN